MAEDPLIRESEEAERESRQETDERAERAANLFDLRRIIGGLFVLYGIVLIIVGLTDSAAEIHKAAGVHINLWAGIGMLVLGIVFLIGQAYDYATLGFGLSDGTFGTTFYTLTGFHGAHVFGGAIMLSVVLYRGLAGQFSAQHHDAVEATSLYWHFVDVVWIALFSTLYLL